MYYLFYQKRMSDQIRIFKINQSFEEIKSSQTERNLAHLLG